MVSWAPVAAFIPGVGWAAAGSLALTGAGLIGKGTGFNDEFVLSDRQIINLSYIQDVRVSKERATTKGTVYEVEFWKNGEKIGTDRYFDEDFFRIKKYLLNKC